MRSSGGNLILPRYLGRVARIDSHDPGRRCDVDEEHIERRVVHRPARAARDFDFGDPRPQTFYSGLYLDLGGQGLVTTIAVPLRDPAAGARGLVGADLTFDIDCLDPAFAPRFASSELRIAAVDDGAEPRAVELRGHPFFVATLFQPELSALAGATATNQYKEATLETGLKVQVPPFIKPGERIRIDTRTAEYLERVK